MLPPFVRILLLVGLLATISATTSFAQSTRYPLERVYAARVVPLQPFSLNTPTRPTPAIQVAFYTTPRPALRTQLPERDEQDADSAPGFETGGSHPMVHGDRAVLRHGIAYAPSNAPDRVKNAIWAVNSICGRPYVWGGGHGSFYDRGYDCSGTVSYALHYAGALNAPLASDQLRGFGERGHGRWITVYSRRGHTFAVIAGLRLDTTDFRYGGNVGPRWQIDGRDTWGFEARHPAKL
jgi:cell wall-associated NlpC family hydrolase